MGLRNQEICGFSGKQIWPSKSVAANEARRLRHAGHPRASSYRCDPGCGGYHITSKPKGAKR
jgi:hypothetical protein